MYVYVTQYTSFFPPNIRMDGYSASHYQAKGIDVLGGGGGGGGGGTESGIYTVYVKETILT
jgi:hypothetical protein